MTPICKRLLHTGLLGLVLLNLAGCGINNIPTYDEAADAAWSDVLNQYQRRAELIPNLVATVKGYAEHERETLNAVVEARSRATAMQLPADIQSRPELLKQFQANQDTLTNALSRLLVVVERYPDLKANQNFLTLQSQLEGTENRIAVARRDYIDAVKVYNTELRTYPGKWWHALLYSELQPRANFEAPAELQRAPAVDFRTR